MLTEDKPNRDDYQLLKCIPAANKSNRYAKEYIGQFGRKEDMTTGFVRERETNGQHKCGEGSSGPACVLGLHDI